jgi:hypothetical protein
VVCAKYQSILIRNTLFWLMCRESNCKIMNKFGFIAAATQVVEEEEGTLLNQFKPLKAIWPVWLGDAKILIRDVYVHSIRHSDKYVVLRIPLVIPLLCLLFGLLLGRKCIHTIMIIVIITDVREICLI